MQVPFIKQLSLLLVLMIFSCESANNSIFSDVDLQNLESAYNSGPSATTGNALIKKLTEVINSGSLDPDLKNSYMEYGLEVAKAQKITSKTAGFLFPLIKNNPNAASNPDRLFELAGVMGRLKKQTAANTLYKGLMDNYPSHAKVSEAKKAMTTPIDSISTYMRGLGEALFDNDKETGIDRIAAMQYVDACEAYALAYPNAPNTADNLFKAAEVAKSIRTFPKSLTLYDWILDKYPGYEKAPTSLFLKGFIIENNVGDEKKAREIYDDFLARYPQHDLADDVEFLIENLGKTDEEILQMIEEKRRQKEAEKNS